VYDGCGGVGNELSGCSEDGQLRNESGCKNCEHCCGVEGNCRILRLREGMICVACCGENRRVLESVEIELAVVVCVAVEGGVGLVAMVVGGGVVVDGRVRWAAYVELGSREEECSRGNAGEGGRV
jgi:hypothetical protein